MDLDILKKLSGLQEDDAVVNKESIDEGMFDGKSREELLKMKAEAEAWFKKNPGGIGSHADSTADFLRDTEQMQMRQYLDFINDALKKVGESKTPQGADGPWYKEQRAKDAYEKANPGKRWADLPYGYKEDWRMKTESASEGVNEASGEFAKPFYELLDDYTGGEQVPQPWATIIDSIVGYMSGDEIADFVDTFRREHDMNHPGEDGDYGDDDANFESVDDVEEGKYGKKKKAYEGEQGIPDKMEETVEVAVQDLQQLLALAGMAKPQATTEAEVELDEYANNPDEGYFDADTQLNKMSGGLNGPKKQYKKEYPGDNPLAVELAEKLKALLDK